MNAHPSSVPDPLDGIVESILQRCRRGERPTLEEYTARYPDFADRLREVFGALVMIEELGTVDGAATRPPAPAAAEAETLVRLGDYRLLREVGRGGMGVVYEAVQESLGRHVALKVLPAGVAQRGQFLERFRREARAAARLHHTNIVPVFGVGEDSGTCYYAMQFIHGYGLDVVLADVKRLRGPAGKTTLEALHTVATESVDVARGLLTGNLPLASDEADAASRGRKPPESATALAGSQSSLSSLPEAHYYRSIARLGMQAAKGLAHAHAQGVLHRDVKPSNLLLDNQGTLWITDFGLAKADDSDDLTHTGDIVGTLRYMAPERFEGRADARSDVYALGVTLYELLTLRLPFAAGDRASLVGQITESTPPPPRSLAPLLPRDLETIVLKAMAKEPAARYATAAALADDLQCFSENRPIRARRTSAWEQTWRWCRRNPLVAGLLVGVALLLVMVAGVSTVLGQLAWRSARQAETRAREAQEAEQAHDRKATEAKQSAEQARQAKEEMKKKAAAEAKQRRRAEQLLYVSRLTQAQGYWQEGKVVLARGKLDETRAQRDTWEHRYLSTLVNHRGQRTFRGHTAGAFSLCFSPDGKRLASGGGDGVRVWNTATGQQTLTLQAHNQVVASVCFSPDGTRLAGAGGFNPTVRVWDAHTGQDLLSLKGHTSRVTSVCFSPDGTRLASASWDQTVKVWDALTGQVILSLQGHTNFVYSVCFSPDGKRLASGSGKTVTVWDAVTGQNLLTLRRHTWGVYSVCFSPDGKRIASGGGTTFAPGEVKVWDAATGKAVLSLNGHTSIVTSVCFSPDGKRIASASRANLSGEPGEVKVWDAHTGQETLALKGHTDWVYSVCFSPDGRHLASASGDRSVKLWDTFAGQQPLAFRGHTSAVYSVCFSPDSQRLASVSPDQTVKVWDVATGHETLTLKGHTCDLYSVCFSPDGKRLVSGGGNWVKPGEIKVWAVQTGKEILSLKGHSIGVNSVCFSRDGKHIASASWDQTVRVWDAHTGKQTLTLKGHTGPTFSVCFSPNGNYLASGGGGSAFGEVKVWNARTGQQTLSLRGHTSMVRGVCFSPDGKRLASASADKTVKVWDAATGQEALTLKGHTVGVVSVCFSPDGKRLVSGAGEYTKPGEVKVWDAHTGQEVLSLKGHTAQVSSVCFSPDGQHLASASWDWTVRVWDAAGEQQLLLPSGNVEGLAGHRLWVEPDYRWHAAQAEQSQQAGDWHACAFHLGRLLPQRPRDAGLYVRRAYALSRLGRTTEAAAHRFQAVLLDRRLSPWPLDPAAARRGQAAAQRQDWPEAAADLELAAHQPGAALATWSDWLLARCAAAPGGLPPTCQQLLDRFEQDGRTGAPLISACLVVSCDVNTSRRLAKVAERLVARRRNASTLHLYGAALYRAGRFKEAADTLRQAIEARGKGGDAESWLFLALVGQRLGRSAQAREHLFRFEGWRNGRTFPTWQQTVRWRLLHEEARTLVLAMPRDTD